MAMSPEVLHNADLLSLPASVPPLDDVFRAARWALMGGSPALADAWDKFDARLHSAAAALGDGGPGAHPPLA